jgi:hypothetical protein
MGGLLLSAAGRRQGEESRGGVGGKGGGEGILFMLIRTAF